MMGYWDGKKCRYEDEKDEKWNENGEAVGDG